MNWTAMRSTLLSAVSSATGIASACWKGSKEAAGWSKGGVVAKLSISSIVGLGCDEERRAKYDAVAKTRTMTLSGARQFTLTVRLETQDGSDAGAVMTLADRLRARVWRESILSSLRAAGMSIADIHPAQILDNVTSQGRVMSVAVVDLIMNGVENDVDDTAGAADWIAQVSATGTLTNENGSTKTVPELTKRVQ